MPTPRQLNLPLGLPAPQLQLAQQIIQLLLKVCQARYGLGIEEFPPSERPDHIRQLAAELNLWARWMEWSHEQTPEIPRRFLSPARPAR